MDGLVCVCAGKKKQEEEIMSMNLGLGASLVLLLSKGAVELNKMVELRAQMEALVSEIRKETQSKHKDSAAVVMHRMEAELQVELSRLQCGGVAAAHGEKRGAPPTMHGLEVRFVHVVMSRWHASSTYGLLTMVRTCDMPATTSCRCCR
jgi:hypothetical protein